MMTLTHSDIEQVVGGIVEGGCVDVFDPTKRRQH